METTSTKAGPSRPVQVLGLTSVPGAGDQLIVADDDRTARARSLSAAGEAKRCHIGQAPQAHFARGPHGSDRGKVETLNLIIKGDSSGSVEALEASLLDIEVGQGQVELHVIHRGVGAVTQSDVDLATVDNAVIIGFNVRPAERVQDLADQEGVEMKFCNVIYSAIDEVEAALKASSSRSTKRSRLALPRSGRSSAPASSATLLAPSFALARSTVATRHALCATAWLLPRI